MNRGCQHDNLSDDVFQSYIKKYIWSDYNQPHIIFGLFAFDSDNTARAKQCEGANMPRHCIHMSKPNRNRQFFFEI